MSVANLKLSDDKDSSLTSGLTIRQATSPDDVTKITKCFQEYTKWLNLDISFQDYASELRDLPGKYAPPTGALLLACDRDTDKVLGCIALKPLELLPEYRKVHDGDIRYCEMKRLFVYPAARGRQVARKLISEVLRIATEEGYDEILLDTLERMTAAVALYESEGFVQTPPYYNNPLEGVRYYKKVLNYSSN